MDLPASALPRVSTRIHALALLGLALAVVDADAGAQTPPAAPTHYLGTPTTTALMLPLQGSIYSTAATHMVDMNGDGRADCVSINGVRLASATGGFLPPIAGTPFTTLPSVMDFVIGDLNGDTIPDVVLAVMLTSVGWHSSGTMAYYYAPGTGTGGFGNALSLPFGMNYFNPYYLLQPMPMIGDTNGDGIADLVLCVPDLLSTTLTATIKTINIVGTLPTLVNTQVNPLLGATFREFALTDLNGDGADELLGRATWTSAFSACAATPGSFNFAAVQYFAIPAPLPSVSYPSAFVMSLADVDGNGLRDPIYVNNATSARELYWAPASPTTLLGPATYLAGMHQTVGGPLESQCRDHRVMDYTGDGSVDILSLHTAWGVLGGSVAQTVWVELRPGTGVGNFANPLVLPLLGLSSLWGCFIATGAPDDDLDGDLAPVVVAQFTPSTATSLLTIPNSARTGRGCPGNSGLTTPDIPGPPPTLGDQGFAFRVAGIAPGANAFLLLSLGLSGNGACGQPTVNLAPGALLNIPTPFNQVTANPLGSGALRVPVPLDIALVGQQLYGQWLVPDASVALGYALSPVRKYIVQ